MKARFIIALVCALMSVSASASQTRSVGRAVWQKTQTVDVGSLVNQPVPFGSTSLFFVRPLDGDDIQTSANIAINDRFQVSLQPGNFSHVYSCSGINELSAEITGRKTNDLSAKKLMFNLEPNDNYFFIVDVDGFGNTSIRHVSQASALPIMQAMPKQSHQISRVVPNNCQQPPVIRPIPIMPPMPVVQRPTIDLQVLFDTDKSVVKTQYLNKIAEVAAFMRNYPTATVAIEGHTDNRASNSYNQALSQRRVSAVRKLLVERYGISSDRINAVGYGESRPVASNATAEGRRQNRRVVAIFDNY